MTSRQSKPGSIIRTDYMRFLIIIRDNPGINKTSMVSMYTGGSFRGSTSTDKILKEILEAGLISEEVRGVVHRFNLTDRGDFVLQAAERLMREVGP